MKQAEEATTDNREAVYYSALALLDELPTHEARAMVAMNWVNYVIFNEANDLTPSREFDISPMFHSLCLEFALRVMSLPETYVARRDAGCSCPRCKARTAAKENLQ